MVREIVFDTETTGFNAEEGERLVEIGAVELINHIPTGKTYHQYINPEKEVPEEAYKVHGLSYDFLKDFPTFDKVADDWLEFIGEDSVLVAHNAQFDINFVNYELSSVNRRWPGTGWLIRWKLPAACFREPEIIWMLYVKDLALTTAAVPTTALCSMRNCWPRFIWS